MPEHDPRAVALYKMMPGASQYVENNGDLRMDEVVKTRHWHFCVLLVQMIDGGKTAP